MAALVWTRRGCRAWVVVNRISDPIGAEITDPAQHNTWPLPIDLNHAADPLGNAGGFTPRLCALCPRAWAV